MLHKNQFYVTNSFFFQLYHGYITLKLLQNVDGHDGEAKAIKDIRKICMQIMNVLAVILYGADQIFLPETEVCLRLLKLLLKYITMQNALFAGIKIII